MQWLKSLVRSKNCLLACSQQGPSVPFFLLAKQSISISFSPLTASISFDIRLSSHP